MAPAGLLFTVSARPPFAVASGVGFGAGATVVRAGVDDEVEAQVALIRLYHLEQSTDVDVVLVVFATAPGVFPAGVSFAAALHAPLFAFPALVQS
jgi:hypothetical protein